MHYNSDFSVPVIITPNDYRWVKSPGGEVNRVMLDRIGEEKARATSLVEFAAQSHFPQHSHPLGEEVLVLSGIFTEDDHQHYPEGCYMRNPHGSAHRVSSETGCRIFVKLMQMTEDELKPIRMNTHDSNNWIQQDGRELCHLFQSPFENTYLEKLIPYQNFSERFEYGVEILVLSGELYSGTQVYPAGSWLRLPQGTDLRFKSAEVGATIYVKSGHLPHAMQVWSHK